MWIATIFLMIIIVMFLCVAAFLVSNYGQQQARQAREYDLKYAMIKKVIDTYEVCDQNYTWIMSLLEHLGSLKYKNREMTEVLTVQFFTKYKAIAEKRVAEES